MGNGEVGMAQPNAVRAGLTKVDRPIQGLRDQRHFRPGESTESLDTDRGCRWHGFGTTVPVRLMRGLVVAAMCAAPTPGLSQSWAEAYKAGDYQRAATLLHPIVAESFARDVYADDPEPARHLALLYGRGLGVERDPIAACALAETSASAAQLSAPRYAHDVPAYARLLANAERFVEETCGGLPSEERLIASRSIGCYGFGMPERVLAVGGQQVRIGRRGIGLAGAAIDSLVELPCPLAVVDVSTRSVGPPGNAAPGVRGRHFIELFTWHLADDPVTLMRGYQLQWHALEVSSTRVWHDSTQPVVTVPGWPGPGLPPGVSAPSLEMIRSGHVRWRFDGDPPKRGWIMAAGGGAP